MTRTLAVPAGGDRHNTQAPPPLQIDKQTSEVHVLRRRTCICKAPSDPQLQDVVHVSTLQMHRMLIERSMIQTILAQDCEARLTPTLASHALADSLIVFMMAVHARRDHVHRCCIYSARGQRHRLTRRERHGNAQRTQDSVCSQHGHAITMATSTELPNCLRITDARCQLSLRTTAPLLSAGRTWGRQRSGRC